MKVTGPGSTGPVGAGGGGAKRAAEPGFAPAQAGAARDAQVASHALGVSRATLDALIALQAAPNALQAAPNALERRRRAVSRAGRLLDVLDDVKLSLLDGGDAGGALQRLRAAVREQREGTDDPRLEGVLDEIETRAAVELAKRQMFVAA